VLPQRIEEASLNAWPALQTLLFDGWMLRFSRGYTKRANSVNALYPSSLDVEKKIARCEARYRERGLPPVFRLTPFASPPDLDRVLADRGYRQIDVTLVLYRELGPEAVGPTAPGLLRNEELDAWLDLFCHFSGSSLAKHQTHREILQAIAPRRLLASLADADQLVACGLGVLEDDVLGLFDLVTAPQQRRQGHGTRLVSGMLDWARQSGAAHAYLQVVAGNEPARRLYARLGFAELYRYWYRVPPR
jgi:GNAT superfamily N-acetyltransferase